MSDFDMTIKCDVCGEDLTGKGILYNVEHFAKCHKTTVVYKVPTDGEMRQMFLELGIPTMVYEFFKYAPPTEMEKIIFEKEREL